MAIGSLKQKLLGLWNRPEPIVTVEAPPVRVDQIIVPEKCYKADEDYELTDAVIHFVNVLGLWGPYTPDELPRIAMQTYHCDYYLAQVKNGGHSQFICNSENGQSVTFKNISEGLVAMGALEHVSIFARMLVWVHSHENEAAVQNGFDQNTTFLDALDRAFYDLDRKSPMTSMSCAHLKSSGQLRVVSDADYHEAMTAMEAPKQKQPAGTA